MSWKEETDKKTLRLFKEESHRLQAKILTLYTESKDEEFAKYFGIVEARQGDISHTEKCICNKCINQNKEDEVE